MTKLITLGTLACLAGLMAATTAFAGELDSAVSSAPQGLVVRVDAQGNREVFKADSAAKVTSDATAEAVAAEYAVAAHQVAKIAPASELDRTTSSEAWYYWYAPTYYGSYYYTYWNTGYSWNYYPCYRWYWQGYNYFYYYWY